MCVCVGVYVCRFVNQQHLACMCVCEFLTYRPHRARGQREIILWRFRTKGSLHIVVVCECLRMFASVWVANVWVVHQKHFTPETQCSCTHCCHVLCCAALHKTPQHTHNLPLPSLFTYTTCRC